MKSVTITIRISREISEKIKTIAQREDRSVNRQISRLLSFAISRMPEASEQSDHSQTCHDVQPKKVCRHECPGES